MDIEGPLPYGVKNHLEELAKDLGAYGSPKGYG
jgi:hypothetical protein